MIGEDEAKEFIEEIEKEDFIFDSTRIYNLDEVMLMKNHRNFEVINIPILDDIYSSFPKLLPCLITRNDFINNKPNIIHYAVIISYETKEFGSVIAFYYQEDGDVIGDEF